MTLSIVRFEWRHAFLACRLASAKRLEGEVARVDAHDLAASSTRERVVWKRMERTGDAAFEAEVVVVVDRWM